MGDKKGNQTLMPSQNTLWTRVPSMSRAVKSCRLSQM